MRTRTAFVGLAALMLLTGCAAQVSRTEVVERFALELGAGVGVPMDNATELIEGLADDALDGRCGSVAYRTGLGSDPGLVYAWEATCLMYFEHDMTEVQVQQAKAVVAEHLAGEM